MQVKLATKFPVNEKDHSADLECNSHSLTCTGINAYVSSGHWFIDIILKSDKNFLKDDLHLIQMLFVSLKLMLQSYRGWRNNQSNYYFLQY